MKTSLHQLTANGIRWRSLAILLAFVCLISFATAIGLSQVRSQKRVTALQLGDSAEGARVTIVSDSALNDYEAFRRGDRFYVKIPQADFSAGNPTFRGNGFEDVRVQEVGDSVIVSFKLQPGATARVDQRSNRLDVIFSAVGTSRSVVPVNVAKSYPTSRNRRNASDSEASAGPAPPISSTPSRESRSSDYTEVETYSGTSYRDAARASTSNRNRRAVTQSGAAQENRRGNTGANSASTNSTSPTSPPTTTTPQPTPYGSNTAATNAATPAAANSNPYGVPVSATSKPPEASSWDSRIKFLKAWAKLNQSALIIGGIVALLLLVGLLFWLRKGRGTAKANPTVKEVKKAKSEKVGGRTVVETPAPVAPRPKAPAAGAPLRSPQVWRPQPAGAGFPKAALRDHREPDQDREVFEL